MISVHLNQQRVQLPEGATLATLIASLQDPPAALATAVNGDFVPREQRAGRVLRDGDQVMTFQPITGG